MYVHTYIQAWLRPNHSYKSVPPSACISNKNDMVNIYFIYLHKIYIESSDKIPKPYTVCPLVENHILQKTIKHVDHFLFVYVECLFRAHTKTQILVVPAYHLVKSYIFNSFKTYKLQV